MKHIDKKLLGIAFVGLSAWTLVVALVFNSTTMAMLTNDPTVPSKPLQATSAESQPQSLGANSNSNQLHTASESSAPVTGEIQSASITQAPAANFAAAGNQDLSSELDLNANTKPSTPIIPIATIAGVFLIIGLALWLLTSRQKPNEKP